MPLALVVNPTRRRRRRRGAAGRFVSARHNPKRRHHRRAHRRHHRVRRHSFMRHVRRNPIRTGRIGAMLSGSVMPVAIGAGGALVADVALGFLPVPASLQTPVAKPLVKAATAITLGIVAGMLTNRSTGAKVMTGGLIVVTYDALRALIQKAAPTVPLGGLAEYPAVPYNGMGELFIPQGEVLAAPGAVPAQLGESFYPAEGGEF